MAPPTIDPETMATLDRMLPERYGITTQRLMAAAGYQIADCIRQHHPDADRIAVVAGPGNNGGDALVAARWLHSWERDVTVTVAGPDRSGPRGDRLAVIQRLGIDVRAPDADLPEADLVVDGLLGYGIEGSPHGPIAGLARSINDSETTTVSVDVPTGLDCQTGELLDPHVRPDTTVTLGLPKPGMTAERCGTVWIADIGIPPEALMAAGIDARGLFRERSLVRYDGAGDPDPDHTSEQS